MLFIYDLVNSSGVQKILSMIYNIVNIIRIIVPIGLIFMTVVDVIKKTINPNDKDGQKKIIYRFIAAVVVFFVPLLISFLMRLIGIGLDGKSNNSTNNSTNNSGNNNTQKEEIKIDNLKIINCPKDSKKYKIGDKVILNTNIPLGFNGSITWSIYMGGKFVTLSPSSDNRFATININDYPNGGFVIVTLMAGGKADTCTIDVEKKEEVKKGKAYGDIKIVNCPIDNVKVGDKITLKADTKEDVVWYGDIYMNYYKYIDNHDGTVTIEITNYFSDILPLRIRVDDKNNKTGYCEFYTIK